QVRLGSLTDVPDLNIDVRLTKSCPSRPLALPKVTRLVGSFQSRPRHLREEPPFPPTRSRFRARRSRGLPTRRRLARTLRCRTFGRRIVTAVSELRLRATTCV